MKAKTVKSLVSILLLVGLIVFPSLVCAKTTLTMAAMGKTTDTYMVAVGWSNVLNKIKSDIAITPLEGGGVVIVVVLSAHRIISMP